MARFVTPLVLFCVCLGGLGQTYAQNTTSTDSQELPPLLKDTMTTVSISNDFGTTAVRTNYPEIDLSERAVADDMLSTFTFSLESIIGTVTKDDNLTTDEILMKTDVLLQEVDALTTTNVTRGRGITLKQAMNIAVQNNTTLKIQTLSPQQREWGIVGEWSAFDPVFRAGVGMDHNKNRSRYDTETSGTVISDSHNFSNDASAGITGSLPTGTSYSFSTGFTRSGNNEDSPWFGGTANFSMTQNLLKGAGVTVNMVGIRQAENSYISSLYQLQNDLTNLVTNVQKAYWDLAIGIRALIIKRINYELSRQRMERTMEMVRVGKTSSIDLFASRADVADSVTQLIQATSAVKTLGLNLKRLLNPSTFPDGWETQFFPLDEPIFNGEEVILNNHLDLAMRLRPDLKQAMLDFDNACLTVVRTENGLLPSLNFSVNTGIGGNGNSPGDAFTNTSNPDQFTYGLGLDFSRPILNRSALSSYNQSQISKQASLESLDNLRQQIQVDVRSALIAIANAKATRQSTRLTREQREKEFEFEQAKYELNRSTQLNVNTTQNNMTQAALNELSAQIAYINSYLTLYAAEGTTLQRAGYKPTYVHTSTTNANRGKKQ